ncbi:MAG: Uncharacterized inner membrane protein RarD, partial [uncultured Blastococcus sp.]
GRAAPGSALRAGRLLPVGTVPALLPAARARRWAGDRGPPGPVVAVVHRVTAHRPAPVGPGARAGDRPATAADPGRGGGADRGQLAGLRLRRQLRPRGRDVAGLLHQPAGERAARRRGVHRAAAPTAVGRRGHRRRRRRRPDHRLRAPTVDRAHAGSDLRPVRAAQEARPGGRGTGPLRRDGAGRDPGRGRARRAARRGRRDVRDGRHRPFPAAGDVGHRHRDPADALRGRRRPDPAVHRGTAPVRHPADATGHRRLRLRRADAAPPAGRFHRRLGRPGGVHRGQPATRPGGEPPCDDGGRSRRPL